MGRPRVPVAVCVHVFPAPPIKSWLLVTVPSPVPPRVPASVPVHPGLNVWRLFPVVLTVSVMLVSLEVPNVWVTAVAPLNEVIPVSVKDRQLPPIA